MATKEDVYQEFIQRLLAVVKLCDQEIQAAYYKRQRALETLNDWVPQAYKEASDGD